MQALNAKEVQKKRFITRWRNEHSKVETAKEAGRIDVERRELPHSAIGKAILDMILTIEKQLNKR